MSFFFVRLSSGVRNVVRRQQEFHEQSAEITHPTQSANSLVFGTVADSRMMLT